MTSPANVVPPTSAPVPVANTAGTNQGTPVTLQSPIASGSTKSGPVEPNSARSISVFLIRSSLCLQLHL